MIYQNKQWCLSRTSLADHAVDLDPSCHELAVFGDLYECARWRAAPDRWDEDEARTVARAGAWAGRELLGDHVPVTVRAGWSCPRCSTREIQWPSRRSRAGTGNTGRPADGIHPG